LEIQKTALITGGAKRLGKAISEDLASIGFNVIIHYNDSEKEALLLRDSLIAKGTKAFAVKANLLVEKEVLSLIGTCNQLISDKISLLVNNASIFEHDNVKTATLESWQRHFKSNLQAPFFLTQKFAEQAPSTSISDKGEQMSNANIINIIDQRVRNLTTDFTTYTLAKSGLWTLTRIAAKTLAPIIRVNAIGPGPTLQAEFQSSENYIKQRKSTPLGRGSDIVEITQTIRFILNNPGISGQLICVDGGQNLQIIGNSDEVD
jgi:NAD(P)-dependent dehydrogenase (short-subunit alcohol dehydrogenase family)